MSGDPVTRVVAALEAGGFDPRPTSADAYESRCPAHNGSRRNLSIARGDNGAALVRCHHEPPCSAEEIARAIGLTMADLFPPSNGQPARPRGRYIEYGGKKRRRYATAEALEAKLVNDANEDQPGKWWKFVCRWIYRTADGTPLFAVVRLRAADGEKSLRTYTRVMKEAFVRCDPEGPLPIYNLPELAAAPTVLVAEGEKCVDALAGLGFTATTSAHGASSAHKSDWSKLAGKDVVILPDNDKEGESYALAVHRLLVKLDPPPRVRVVRMADIWDAPDGSGPAEGDDIADWIERGTRPGLEPADKAAILSDAIERAPIEDPPPPEEKGTRGKGRKDEKRGGRARGRRPERERRHDTFTNAAEEVVDEPAGGRRADAEGAEEEAKVRHVPMLARDIMTSLHLLCHMAGRKPPRTVGPARTLFVEGPDGRPLYLDTEAKLFAWIQSMAPIEWKNGVGYARRIELFEYLRHNSQHFDAIETLPHEPALPAICYMHEPVPASDGSALAELIGFFNPATDLDRSLIEAFYLTPFWGGPPGTRPAFMITGPEDDPEGGRGVGKSTLLDTVADLAGGAVDVSSRDDMERIKTRFLSPEGARARLARVDNLKTPKLSWDDLESTTTARYISGHELFKGEGRRPNVITWAITVNGGAFSRDMAQRIIPIRLNRPEFDASWDERVRRFLAERRWAIIADIVAKLAAPAPPLPTRTRWGTWEKGVLARVPNPAACQALIVERQGEFDDDRGDALLIEDFLRDQLDRLGYDAERATVFIANRILAEWVSTATGQRRAVNRLKSYLETIASARLSRSKDGARAGRGWRWTGPDAPPHQRAAHDLERRIAEDAEGRAARENGRAAAASFGGYRPADDPAF